MADDQRGRTGPARATGVHVHDGGHTVVVLVADDRAVTRGFCDLLAHCLDDGDTVLLAGPRPRESDARSWRTARAGMLVRPKEVPGWGSVVVVVDERTVPVGPWIVALERALDDPQVGAAAARTNVAAGDELLIGVPYRPWEVATHRELVRRRAGERSVTGATRLAGPSLALRHRDFRVAGGLSALAHPEPVAELARRVGGLERRLVVAEGAYLHVTGGPGPRAAAKSAVAAAPAGGAGGGAPLVSACLIVKDERENLPRCLRSLERFADEVVVYDTGSTDGTPEVARAQGAQVAQGHWDGDFSRARNAALARCRGQWVLWIDADEELVCDDRPAARQRLAEMPATIEACIVPIDNLRGTAASTALTHPACRLFRRAYGHWVGRLHEQVNARAGTPDLQTARSKDVRITHWGYLERVIDERAKGRRNVRSAFSDLTGDGALSWETRLVSLARSYGFAGQPEEAVDLCRAALGGAPSKAVRRLALRALVDDLLILGDGAAALRELSALRAVSSSPVAADLREGRALLALGRPAEALGSFARLEPGIDDDGFELGAEDTAADRARALSELGRFDEAADVLLECLGRTGGLDVPVSTLLTTLERAGRDASELAAIVPGDRAVAFLGQLVHLPSEVADRALDAWHATAPSVAVLATAATVAARLPVHRQLAWSARLRGVGLAHACPLVAGAGDPARPARARVLGAALAAHLFADPRGHLAVVALAATLGSGARAALRQDVESVAPSVLAMLDDIPAAAPPPPGERSQMPGSCPEGERSVVLLVDRQPASIRTVALAASLRRAGHRVTVSWPAPPASPIPVLEATGVVVRPWSQRATTGATWQGATRLGATWQGATWQGATWQGACAEAVAAAYADQRIDAVVLGASAACTVDLVRALVPAATVLVDPDDTALPEPAATLLDAAPAAPWTSRAGIAVVGDFAVAGDAALGRFARVVAPALCRHLGTAPIVVIGGDPQGRVTGSLPGALALGATEDPLPWLRAVRAVLVATQDGARHWAEAASLAGTPVLHVPPGGTGTDPDRAIEPVCEALAALAAALTPPPTTASPAPTTAPADPLATLTAPADPLATLTAPADPLATLTAPAGRNGSRGRGQPARIERAPAVEVRRGMPPDLAARRAARCIVELRWGYASVPIEWLGPLRDVADEVRVPGPWGAAVLEAAGLRSGTVRIVPPAVDTEQFAPELPPASLPTNKSVRFLFVGDCDGASGIDALLEAYYLAFDADDDVCLVVHPTGPPALRTFEPDIRRAAEGARGRPEVAIVEEARTGDEVAGLYRACDVLVHPHRAAGSPDTVLAAMASGRPVVTLDAGAGADVCDDRTGWLVPCRTVPADAPPWLVATRTLRQLEPSRAALAEVLRVAAGATDLRIRKGLAARDRAVSAHALGVTAG